VRQQSSHKSHRYNRSRRNEHYITFIGGADCDVRLFTLDRNRSPGSEWQVTHCPARLSSERSQRTAHVATDVPTERIEIKSSRDSARPIDEQHRLLAIADHFCESPLRAPIH
jgi:hypothetical protein